MNMKHTKREGEREGGREGGRERERDIERKNISPTSIEGAVIEPIP
jgi:hypothetical protein